MRVRSWWMVIMCSLLIGAACSTKPADSGGEVPLVEPSVEVTVDRPEPGAELWVETDGFPPRAVIEVGVGPVASEYEVIARTEAGENGAGQTLARLPADAEAGAEWVVVARVPETGIKAVSEPFEITGTAGGKGTVQVLGILTDEGVECQALRSDKGLLYTLAGDLGDAGPGDRVRVIGDPVEMSTCMQGTTLRVESLEVLSDSLRESDGAGGAGSGAREE